jgi:hypothetical protein
MRHVLLAAALLALVPPGAARAGRPLTTEDATTLAERACQLEAWVDRDGDGNALGFAAPACTRFGVEWQVGAARAWPDAGRNRTVATYAQAKHAFRSIDEGDWGVGITLGLTRALDREVKNDWGDPYVIVPLSLGFGDDPATRTLVHLNLGTTRNRAEARDLTLWGVAIEKPVTEKLTLLAEGFGENSRKPFFRAGGRYAVAGGFDLDLTFVTRSGGERADRYVSLGLHWETEPFLP